MGDPHGVHIGKEIAKIARPQNTRLSLLFFISFAVYGHLSVFRAITSCLLIILVYGMVTAYNDLHDVEIDRHNRRDLPLVSGTISPRIVRNFILICSALALLLQPWIGQPTGLLFAIIYILLGWAYSSRLLRISDRGLFATALLSTCYTLLPIFLALGQSRSNVPSSVYWEGGGAVMFSAAFLLFKDFRNEKGDRLGGKRTPLIRHGVTSIGVIAWLLVGIGLLTLRIGAKPGPWALVLLIAFFALWKITFKTRPSKAWAQVFAYSSLGAVATALLRQ